MPRCATRYRIRYRRARSLAGGRMSPAAWWSRSQSRSWLALGEQPARICARPSAGLDMLQYG
eukprot:scaffold638_cov382-Prasinococcus_capsulatus_cf.AAC.5